ncbi:MAG: hypothetical protein GDA51_10065 [Ekhidna sp.]|nr:hypothetical protein [Ekhidna sp.]
MHGVFEQAGSGWFKRESSMNEPPVSIAIEPATACNLKCPEYVCGVQSFTAQPGNQI